MSNRSNSAKRSQENTEPPQVLSQHAEALPPGGASRRRLLLGAAAAPVAVGAAATLRSAPTRASLQTNARIVVVGSGLAGLAVANRLVRELDGADITVVDRKEEHNYQPGYTLVGTGIWPVDKVIDRNADLMPEGVRWVREMVAEYDPDHNALITDSGKRIDYDYLVVATGCHLDYEQIEGMDPAAIGKKGLTSVYNGPKAVTETWKAMDTFRQRGGKAVMTLPATPIKCAGAPLKTTFMLVDRLRQAGTFERSQVEFHSALGVVFGVPVINQRILERWADWNVPVHFSSKLVAVDIDAQRATFESPEGERTVEDYDFIHVVPPMRAPDSLFHSPLAAQEGPMAAGGWLEVDRETLRHRRYGNVFGVGDINGTPRGKTAATVKQSVPKVVANLIDVIAGREPSMRFDGYTSCPMILREGSAWLIEFDYEGRLTPSLPMIEPLQDSWFAWLMKVQLLKPAYMAVAKGRV